MEFYFRCTFVPNLFFHYSYYTLIYMKRFFFLLFLMGVVQMRAMPLDGVRVSLLTCAPGSEIYSLFGHSAIRYENPSLGQDWVFNYGMFSFNSPNFVMRFVKGETDYQLGVVPYRHFEAEYALRGSAVYQQTLNLTDVEKERLFRLLEENYLPANRIYRYNYFYDNCTTRARDKIEEALDGIVDYPKNETTKSFREIIHEYTKGHEWSELGIDLCLGSEADEPIDERKQMFAPFYMLAAARGATILRGDSVVPLVLNELKIVDGETEEDEMKEFASPLICAWLFLLMTGLVVGVGIKKGFIHWTWDLLVFGLQGIGGCIISFLFFFSIHPTVGSNWMIVMLNPIPLLYLPWMVYRNVKRKKDYYHWFNLVVLTSFMILMPFLQQQFNATVLPLALCFWLTSIGHLYLYYRKN